MAYEYVGLKKHYTVYRIGSYPSEYFATPASCKIYSYNSTNLSSLLKGYEKSCNTNDAFKILSKTIVVRSKNREFELSSPILPKEIFLKEESRIKSVITPNGDYSLINIGISGNYKGLDVVQLELSKGHGNGINSATVIFAANASEVSRKLGGDWSIKPRTIEPDDGSSYTYGLSTRGFLTGATCDWSN